MDSHESVVAAALREAAEECGVPPDAVTVTGVLADDHGTWAYRTVLGLAAEQFPVHAASAETAEAAWVEVAKVERLALHPGFAAQWPVLREALQPLTIIVDVANVMGSRPDGWWRDRAGAARRLRDQLAGLAARGVCALPPSVTAPALERWFPDFVLVVEGQARGIAGDGGAGGRVRVVAADGSGDDTIAALAGELPGLPPGRHGRPRAARPVRRGGRVGDRARLAAGTAVMAGRSDRVPGRCLGYPGAAGRRPAPAAAGTARARAGLLGPGAGRLAGDPARHRPAGAAGRRDLHGGRSEILHRARGRAEHAVPGRRRAQAAPGPVLGRAPGRRFARPAGRFHPGRGGAAGGGDGPGRAGRAAARAGRSAGRGGRRRGARPARHRSRTHPVLV